IRRSLLDGDVEYSVVKNFIARVKEKALGTEVMLKAGQGQQKMKVRPGDHFIKICQDELADLMGSTYKDLVLPNNRVSSFMMVGLQGVGKTTASAKLANYLKNKKKRRPLLVAADTQRPAAAAQLEVLGARIGVPVFHKPGFSALEICKAAKERALELDCDTIILDTAGRLAIDQELMAELEAIKAATKPEYTLLVCDAMMGQDAVTTAKTFHEKLDISSFIMTKLDGDARGGAALSIKEITGRSIQFLGTGEELDRLEEFRPEGLASRILGMGDMVGLMDDFERVSKEGQEEDALRMLQGQFNFTDFYEQISAIQKMGPLKDILAKLPIQGLIPKGVQVDDRELGKIKSMIDSMTKKERLNPDLIDTSRAKRIAAGSARTVKELAELLHKFKTMRKAMGSFGKNLGLMGKIPGMNAFNQMRGLKQMASAAAGGGGMGGGNPFAAMMGGMGGGNPFAQEDEGPRRVVDRDKLKKARKLAKSYRKKNRK
ncbi:MAG: signal recognition particle protein, partial [Oligoflexales bacterium]|nr:signal recognition particle protein [Oligoflexales bacterium]